LALYGDYLIFGDPKENRILLNLGGIANFTHLPKSQDPKSILSTDVGPSNTMMDAYVRFHFPKQSYDADAKLAFAGKVNTPLLDTLLNHPFFALAFPKTTGPELFNLDYLRKAQEKSQTEQLSPEDVLATLNQFSAKAIVNAIQVINPISNYTIYASGGGIHNPLLLKNIQTLLPQISIKTTLDLGIPPDAKEAVLFALLANECVAAETNIIGNPTLGIPSITMGKISFAD